MELKFGPDTAPMVAKKVKKDFLKIIIFFKMAAIFRPNLAILDIFDRKMAAILKKMKIFKKSILRFFAPTCTPTWPNFRSIGPPQQK